MVLRRLYTNGGVASAFYTDKTYLRHFEHERLRLIATEFVESEIFPAVAFYGANRGVRLMAIECIGARGPGMRYYPSTDPFKRKKWEILHPMLVLVGCSLS